MPGPFTHHHQPANEDLIGLIERITFHNFDSGFFVVRARVKGHRELVTVVGTSQTINVGENFRAEGKWIMDAVHGRQFKALSIVSYPPSSTEGIIKYLSSGLIKGIGPVYGQKLVKAFGEDVFDVIENNPERLDSLEGVGPKRKEIIVGGWQEQKQIREIMVFLHAHALSTARAVRIYKTYGNASIDVLHRNPYKLSEDIRGIGFLSADKIAATLGIEKNSAERIKAGLSHMLKLSFEGGLCGVPTEQLITKTATLLGLEPQLVEEVLRNQITEEKIIEFIHPRLNLAVCYVPVLYHTERQVSLSLRALCNNHSDPFTINADQALSWLEKRENAESFTLSPSQRSALHTALESKVCVITGGPGVGKTTLVKCLLNILTQKTSQISLVAPTGRAAKRLSESTGQAASTLHKLLSYSPISNAFKYNEDNKLSGDVFIVDESSMIDVFLMHAFLKAVRASARLYVIGDVDQLPSVGPGQVLLDMIMSESIPVVRLTEIFRQGEGSKIVSNAHLINKGQVPNAATVGGDFNLVTVNEAEEGLELIKKYMSARITGPEQAQGIASGLPKIQLLTPMKSGPLGTHALNNFLQGFLNKNKSPSVTIFGQAYLVHDPVIQTVNNYDKDVYNGDIGFITEINNATKQVIVRFDDSHDVAYDFGEMDQVDLSYAMTIHKSQGSEFPVVVMPLFMSHQRLLMKNLVYTGITRGKQKVIVIAQEQALINAVNNKTQLERYSLLSHWLSL